MFWSLFIFRSLKLKDKPLMQMLKSPTTSVERALKNSLSPSCQRPLNLIMQMVWPSQLCGACLLLVEPVVLRRSTVQSETLHYTTTLAIVPLVQSMIQFKGTVTTLSVWNNQPIKVNGASRLPVDLHNCIKLVSAPVCYFLIPCIFDRERSHPNSKKSPDFPLALFRNGRSSLCTVLHTDICIRCSC